MKFSQSSSQKFRKIEISSRFLFDNHSLKLGINKNKKEKTEYTKTHEIKTTHYCI